MSDVLFGHGEFLRRIPSVRDPGGGRSFVDFSEQYRREYPSPKLMEVHGNDVMSRQHVTRRGSGCSGEGRSDTKEFKTIHSVREVMATMFWDPSG